MTQALVYNRRSARIRSQSFVVMPALADIAQGLTPAQAARKHEVSESVVYRALRGKRAIEGGKYAPVAG